MKALLVVTVLIAACGEKRAPSPVTNEAEAPSCPAQAAELKTWIAVLLDPAQNVAAPWPTGDASFDAELDKSRAKLRETRSLDPDKPAPSLGMGPKRGRIDDELAPCPQGTEQLKVIGEADDKNAAWMGLADAIGACDCKTNISIVKAWLYFWHRGPD